MRQLLQKLSIDAIVVVDAPPLLPVTDAAVLAGNADGAFIVVSSGRTLDNQLDAALQSLKAVDAKPLGVILNRVARRDASGGYYGVYYGQEQTEATGKRRAGKPESPRRTIKQRLVWRASYPSVSHTLAQSTSMVSGSLPSKRGSCSRSTAGSG